MTDEGYRDEFGYYDDNSYAAGTVTDAARRSEDDPVLPTDRHASERVDAESKTIELHEEDVNIHTQKRNLGNVEISKEVIEETKTVEVPVEREELHIKHTIPTDDTTLDGDAVFEEETIEVPLSEDEIIVDKETRITDQVEIEKTTHTDTQSISETERREELIIDDETGRLKEDSDLSDNKK